MRRVTPVVAGVIALGMCVGCADEETVSEIPLHAIDGTVTGLTASGLVLQNNGGDDLMVAANGDFVFPLKIREGRSYDVTVKVQPTWQICSVAGAAGTVGATDIASVAVTCWRSQAVYFAADDETNVPQLWRTDGTGAGTSPVTGGLPGGEASSPDFLAVAGGHLFFAGITSTARLVTSALCGRRTAPLWGLSS